MTITIYYGNLQYKRGESVTAFFNGVRQKTPHVPFTFADFEVPNMDFVVFEAAQILSIHTRNFFNDFLYFLYRSA